MNCVYLSIHPEFEFGKMEIKVIKFESYGVWVDWTCSVCGHTQMEFKKFQVKLIIDREHRRDVVSNVESEDGLQEIARQIIPLLSMIEFNVDHISDLDSADLKIQITIGNN